MKEEAFDRVIAAIQHARVMMLRERSKDDIDRDLTDLVRLGEATVPIEDAYATAIELLASLPTDVLEPSIERYRSASKT